jgi:hypothetical protein
MTGYEKSQNYGDPESGWRADVFVVLLVVALLGMSIYVLMR